MGKLEGKVVLVTGAAGRQGAAEARLFAAEGAKVVVTDVLEEEGRALAASLGGDAVWAKLDVSNAAEWASAVALGVSRFGKLDVLVNNAGIWPQARMEDMTEETFMLTVRVNQLGTWLGMKAVIAPMREAGGGSIVNIASVAGLQGMAGLSAYVGTKHAVRGLSKTAAVELGHYGIRVNSIYPGAIVGEGGMPGVDLPTLDAMFAHLPVPRVGRPNDIAQVALFLASDDSSYCTGAEIVADGGAVAGNTTLSPRPSAQPAS